MYKVLLQDKNTKEIRTVDRIGASRPLDAIIRALELYSSHELFRCEEYVYQRPISVL